MKPRHTGFLEQPRPGFRVELRRRERRNEILVTELFGRAVFLGVEADGRATAVIKMLLIPLGRAAPTERRHRIKAPMHENPELRFRQPPWRPVIRLETFPVWFEGT